MADVFISYKSDRRAIVEHIARVLELNGYSVWFDRALVAGEEFSSPIERELRSAKAAIVLWCSLSVGSDWVREEASLAKRLRKLIPVRLERVEAPLGFASLQMVDLYRWDGGPRSHSLDALLLEVARLVGRDPVPQVRALMDVDLAWRNAGAPAPSGFALKLSASTLERRSAEDAPAAPIGASTNGANAEPRTRTAVAATAPTQSAALADPSAETRPSIAVLPFRMLQAEPDQAYFGEGVVDAVIHALAGLKDLTVLSRGSTLAFGRRPTEPLKIGRRLGVRYVLAGAVSRAAGRLRIVTELTDAESGIVVSADRYDGTTDDLFALQDEISLKLVRTIAPHVRERELRRALRKHPASMTAYDLLLQAMDLIYRMDAESFAAARSLLERAIALDPGYALPYTYAAWWHIFRVGEIGSLDPDADARAASDYASAAISRDANDALALSIFGHVQAFLLRDLMTARRTLDRAIDLGPSVAMAWIMSSATHGFAGDGPSAVAHALRAQRLAPADPYAFWYEGLLAQAHYVNGDYSEAVAVARGILSNNRNIRFTMRTLSASLAAQGRSAEARDASAAFLRLHPDFRLCEYAKRCAFVGRTLERWIGDLRAAGLPE